MNRREFLSAAVAVPLLLRRAPLDVRIVLVGDGSGGDAISGARLAAKEAMRTAQLLGGSIQLVQSGTATSAVVITTIDVENIVGPGCVIETSALPTICNPSLFYIQPTVTQQRLAGDVITVWDPSLEKFGAAQLNDRYRAEYSREMSADAWAGWCAIKIIWESALRTRSARSEDIAAFLRSSRGAFDGHKGELLRFSETNVLQQPLYIRQESAIKEWRAPESSYSASYCS